MSQLPRDRGLLPRCLLSFCKTQNTEASLLHPGRPSLRPEQRAQPHGKSRADTTANPRHGRQKEETDVSPLLYNIPGLPSAGPARSGLCPKSHTIPSLPPPPKPYHSRILRSYTGDQGQMETKSESEHTCHGEP